MTQKETIKKVLHYIRRYRFFLIASLVLALITVVLTLYVPILTGQAVDLIVGKGQVDFAGVYRICVKIGIAILLTMVAQWVMNVANNKITYSVVRDIRTDAFEKIQVLPLSYIDSHSYGGIVSRVIADADQFADGLLMGFTQLFTGVITILGTLGFMLSVSVPIALVVVVLTPVSLFVAAFIAKRTYQMFRMQSETRGEQTALIEEMIGNQKVVQAFGQENEVGDRFDEINDRLSKYSLQGTFFSSITNPSTRFVNALVYAAVGVFGAFFAIQGGISVGQLSCFLSYANQYTKPFNEISGVVTELQNAIACAGRVLELIEETPEIPDSEDAIKLGKADGKVEIEDVYFSYEEDREILKGINLNLPAGSFVSLVGESGCGKSTIAGILAAKNRGYNGEITIGGVPLNEVNETNLMQRVVLVRHNSYLFKGTVEENLKMAKPDATKEEMEAVLQKVNLLGFLQTQDGLQTQLLEKASNLSGGQCQRLVIARALLRTDSAVYIFDEAASNIDVESEELIMNVIHELAKTKTVLLISHRLANVVKSDKIYFLKDGEIKESGKHDELMSRNGAYRHLYESQMALENYGKGGVA